MGNRVTNEEVLSFKNTFEYSSEDDRKLDGTFYFQKEKEY